ncbi:FHA domain-containing protein [Luteimonas sp. MJ293]|uniref:FHA domain-containing protein n=1 Tax=Luteimonas sp. MJ146 TaxID=3129240 RepID=UPI0031BB7F8E
MSAARLRFISSDAVADLPLAIGMHHLGRVGAGLGPVPEGDEAIVCLCVDRRGVWLTVGNGRRGVHVNGREISRLAMLRVGDSVFVDGHEVRLVGAHPPESPPRDGPPARGGSPDPRMVLRGLGGRHHGRSFTLDVPRLVGRVPGADIQIDDPVFAERHARLEIVEGQVWLRDLGTEEGSLVNGESVHDAVLQPGDQVVFDNQYRFVVEAPRRDAPQEPLLMGEAFESEAPHSGNDRQPSLWRLPLVLLAALLIAGLLALLLLYGAG